VSSNKAIAEIDGEEDLVAQWRISKAQAKANLDHLSGFSGNLLAVLFNVYSETMPQSRGAILQSINMFLSICPHSVSQQCVSTAQANKVLANDRNIFSGSNNVANVSGRYKSGKCTR
jgi:hypothetical protein